VPIFGAQALDRWRSGPATIIVCTSAAASAGRQMVMSGSHAALTSELDVAQELLDGRIVAIPVTGQNVVPQNITLAISAKRTLPRIATRVAELLAGDIAALLVRVRAHPMG